MPNYGMVHINGSQQKPTEQCGYIAGDECFISQDCPWSVVKNVHCSCFILFFLTTTLMLLPKSPLLNLPLLQRLSLLLLLLFFSSPPSPNPYTSRKVSVLTVSSFQLPQPSVSPCEGSLFPLHSFLQSP